MLRRVLPWVACAAMCLLSVPAPAQEVPDSPQIITYTTLGMSPAVDGPVVDVDTDSTNRVWAVTPGSASAALGGGRAPLFPIDVGDTGLPLTARFRSVSFANPAGNAADGEFFFLGSSANIAWGRVTSAIEFRAPLLVSPPGGPFPPGDDPNNVADTDSDGSDWLWAATSGGLVLWDLRDPVPSLEDIYLDSSDDGPIQYVAVAPWGEAAAVDGDRLWLVDVLGNATLVRQLSSGVFVGITFDSEGNLWAASTLPVAGFPQLLKFESNGTPGADPTGLTGVSLGFPLNPFLPAGAPSGFAPTDIAFDSLTDRVWVTAASSSQGPLGTAYYQLAVGGNLNEDPAVNSWGVVSSTFDSHTEVHADEAGNAWFGMAGDSNEAINGYVVRLLTLDKSRYLGSTSGVASLVDLSLFGGNGTPDEETTITIAVSSDARPFTVTEQGDTGQFSQSFQIVPSGAAGGEGNVFQVSSSATDVPVVATYTFDDADKQPRELTATASWANIEDFDDDWWIGDFPCFLRSLHW